MDFLDFYGHQAEFFISQTDNGGDAEPKPITVNGTDS